MRCKKRGQIIVFLALFLLVFSSLVLADEHDQGLGCFILPQAGAQHFCEQKTQADAEELCGRNNIEDCNRYFIQGQDCNNLETCEIVKCNVDCSSIELGLCEYKAKTTAGRFIDDHPDLDGRAVLPEEVNLCGPRCCQTRGDLCLIKPNGWECLLSSINERGLSPLNGGYGDTTITEGDACVAFCGLEVGVGEVIVTVMVNGELFPAEVSLGNYNSNEEDGIYTFREIPRGGYSVSVTADGYARQTKNVNVLPGESTNVEFNLESLGQVSFSVRVQKENGESIDGASVTWREGVSQGGPKNTIEGVATFEDLNTGDYFFTASKEGYRSETANIQIVEGGQIIITLSEERDISFSGSVTLNGEPKVGATIIVDGRFRGTTDSDGNFIINQGLTNRLYRVKAMYRGYEFLSPEYDVDLTRVDQRSGIALTLQLNLPPCVNDKPPIVNEKFNAVVKPGKNKIEVSWVPSCSGAAGYRLTRDPEWSLELGNKREFELSNFYFLDENLEWGQVYTYSIEVIYLDDGLEVFSKTEREISVNVGDEACKDKFVEGIPMEFCIRNDNLNRFKCNINNVKEFLTACEEGTTFCAPSGPLTATCRSAECVLDLQPFGLYGNANTCYGVASGEQISRETIGNYCAYDYSATSIANECKSCEEVTSCFDYLSSNACEANSCFSENCRWVDAGEGSSEGKIINFNFLNNIVPTTLETGKGYCVQDNYQGVDRCSLCGANSTLFENNFCSGDVCSALGDCYASPGENSCNSCYREEAGKKVLTISQGCHTYATQSECTQGQEFSVDGEGKLTFSTDSCGLGRCVWAGGSCIKDGDANGVAECDSLGEACKKDNQGPTTTFTNVNNVVNLENPTLNFEAIDNTHLSTLYYCLSRVGPDEFDTCGEEGFTSVSLGNSALKKLGVDLSDTYQEANGENYVLRYYSIDKNMNREEMKKAFVVVDFKKPDFDIEETALPEKKPVSINVEVTNYFEPISCEITLKAGYFGLSVYGPVGKSSDEILSHTFTGLSDFVYDVVVKCTDENGNSKNKTKHLVYDPESRVKIISPLLWVPENFVNFEIETLERATCLLSPIQGKPPIPEAFAEDRVAHFIPNENLRTHRIEQMGPFFPETEYLYEIKCTSETEEYTPKPLRFFVDLDGPSNTRINLQEEEGRFQSIDGTNWQEYFRRPVTATFSCLIGDEGGLDCPETKYCIEPIGRVEVCNQKGSENYLSAQEAVFISESVRICYYSIDSAGHEEEGLSCGFVRIEGYGISLVQPKPYLIMNGDIREMWGFDKNKTFDVLIDTKLPVTECKYSLLPIRDEQSYNNGARTFSFSKEGDLFKIKDFPEGPGFDSYSAAKETKSIYVKCKDIDGEFSEDRRITLQYDPTKPVITSAIADPNPVIQGKTKFIVETDVPTVCNFDDDENVTTFTDMQSKFPTFEENFGYPLLLKKHEVEYNPEVSGEYTLAVACKNGAGNVSSFKNISFTVDYSLAGEILSTLPEGYIKENDITLLVLTSKDAECSYSDDGSPPRQLFSQTGRVEHENHLLELLEDGEYIYPLSCQFAQREAQGRIQFTIDNVAPNVTSVVDGNHTCSLSEIEATIYTDEQSIANHFYEVYKTGSATKIAEGTVPQNEPIKVTGLNLTEGQRYYLKVRSQDAAGNWGDKLIESDGVLAVPENYTECANDREPPRVNVQVNSTCTSLYVTLFCEDDVSTCKDFKYGKHSSASGCNASLSYGNKIPFDRDGWVCYNVQDAKGNKNIKTERVAFLDSDADGINDGCDQCANTGAGKIVGMDGCATGQVPGDSENDQDGDGLPDYWEKIYSSEECLLNFEERDSNGNGKHDGEEDYDLDGVSNFNEYLANSDPCIATDKPFVDLNAPEGNGEEQFEEVVTSESNVLAWVFLIIGLLMVLGGVAYLIYYYKSGKSVSDVASTSGKNIFTSRPIIAPRKEEPVPVWKRGILRSRKERKEKIKTRERKSLFSSFGKNSKKIPKMDSFLNKNVPHDQKIHGLAKHYLDHKDEIKPGLRKEESGIFSKLEKIGKQREKDPSVNVGKKEAKSIFDKLKDISENRKK